MARATVSLPVPLSSSSSTGRRPGASLEMLRYSRRISADCPVILPNPELLFKRSPDMRTSANSSRDPRSCRAVLGRGAKTDLPALVGGRACLPLPALTFPPRRESDFVRLRPPRFGSLNFRRTLSREHGDKWTRPHPAFRLFAHRPLLLGFAFALSSRQ